MADTFLLEIITPTRRLLSIDAEELTAPGALGEFGILPGHMHFFSLLNTGVVSYRSGRESGRIVINSGYAEVGPEKTILLVDRAVTEDEIDIEEARDEIEAATERMKDLTPDDPVFKAAERDIEFAEARIGMKKGPSK